MSGYDNLPEHNKAFLADIARTWALMPSLRFGQLISHAVDAADGLPSSLRSLPITEDEYMRAAFARLRTQTGHPDAE